MGVIVYTLLILMVGAVLVGAAFAMIIVGGIAIIAFLIAYLVYETIMWVKGKKPK